MAPPKPSGPLQNKILATPLLKGGGKHLHPISGVMGGGALGCTPTILSETRKKSKGYPLMFLIFIRLLTPFPYVLPLHWKVEITPLRVLSGALSRNFCCNQFFIGYNKLKTKVAIFFKNLLIFEGNIKNTINGSIFDQF